MEELDFDWDVGVPNDIIWYDNEDCKYYEVTDKGFYEVGSMPDYDYEDWHQLVEDLDLDSGDFDYEGLPF